MHGRWYAAAGVGFAGAALALSLTGVAGGAMPAAAPKQVTKKQAIAIAKKQANQAITARAPRLSVGSARTAAPTGSAGGSLTGSFPNPVVAPGAIGTPNLAEGAVTGTKLADGSVTTGKLAPGSVGADTLADESVTNAKLAGPAVAARNLMQGAVNANALGPVAITTATDSVLTGQAGTLTVTCPGQSRLLTGGGSASSTELVLVSSYPHTANSWRVVYQNTGGSTHFFSAVVSCLQTFG